MEAASALRRRLTSISKPPVGGLFGLLLLIALPACTVMPAAQDRAIVPLLVQAGEYHGTRPHLPTPADVHHLTVQQQQHFLDYFHSSVREAVPPPDRLYSYLQRSETGFEYSNETLMASAAIALNSGNCLSLAIKTTALAQLVGLEVGWQLLSDAPVYDLRGPFVEKGVHVRSLIYNPVWEEGARWHDPGPYSIGITIDYLPTGRERFIKNIRYEDYLAMYYRNLAVESLRSGDSDLAWWYAMEALEYAVDHPDALNTLAVISRQQGRHDVAEEIYRYAISRADDKLTLLKNYRSLLASKGRLVDAARIEAQLEAIPDTSPFNWYQVANSAFDEQDYRRAIRYYQRALTLAPYLHEAYLGIATAWYQLGQQDRAEQALRQAIAQASRRSSRKAYETKLAAYYTQAP